MQGDRDAAGESAEQGGATTEQGSNGTGTGITAEQDSTAGEDIEMEAAFDVSLSSGAGERVVYMDGDPHRQPTGEAAFKPNGSSRVYELQDGNGMPVEFMEHYTQRGEGRAGCQVQQGRHIDEQAAAHGYARHSCVTRLPFAALAALTYPSCHTPSRHFALAIVDRRCAQ